MAEIVDDAIFLEWIRGHAQRYGNTFGWDIVTNELSDEQILELRGAPAGLYKSTMNVFGVVKRMKKERDQALRTAAREAREASRRERLARKAMSEEDKAEEKARRAFERAEKRALLLLEKEEKKAREREARRATRADENVAKRLQREERAALRVAEGNGRTQPDTDEDDRPSAVSAARRLMRSRNGSEEASI